MNKRKRKDVIKKTVGFLIAVLFLEGILLIVMFQLEKASDTLDECKDQGYDGVRYEKVNYFQEKLICATFTDEEWKEIEDSSEFNEVGEDVWNAFIGGDKEGSGKE